MKVLFYCSASFEIDPKFNQAAHDIVCAACALGYDIVSGGTIKGTMKVVADAAVECGAKNIGVIPRFMEQYVYPGLTECTWTETMSERKEKMRDGVDAVVALPGGIGTLDELIETFVLVKLDRYHGKVIVANIDGFYEPLKALLDHYVATGMLDAASRQLIVFPSTVEEVTEALK
ncbi:MAG: TIGR00730 family Rossman fold protein [Bacteroidales bacterium]|nr:TIGR00730 family Rossman fold protein [Bacteroidales bacterium]